MKNLDTNLPTSLRRGAIRMDQDGPWSVSVAETPYDAHSFSLYIKTPTHNLTLTRTAMELVELDVKLRQCHSNIKLPPLPISPDTLPPPPKRKSTFLNTLSRLASPTSTKHQRRPTNPNVNLPLLASPLSVVQGLPPISTTTSLALSYHDKNDPSGALGGDSPLQSPEMGDSQSSFQGSVPTSAVTATENAGAIDVPPQAPPTPSAKSTALAAYLTTISNIPCVRADRVWKRFVRVRTDDLESVRVERAIKRVRSDLAAHVSVVPSKDKENVKAADGCDGVLEGYGEKHEGYEDDEHMPPNVKKETEDDTKLEINQENKEQDLGHPTKEINATESTLIQENIDERGPSIAEGQDGRDPSINIGTEVPADRVIGEEAGQISTPLASEVPSRIPRSHSAEPDKSHRFSRSFASSVPSQSGAESQTGDDSSSSAAAAILMGGGRHRENRKKRRSHSRAAKEPKEPKKSLRKVCVDDFEMTRVLGKGCAGKVLLVRQKSTAELFALKAITKRHVLAHQELQHTLTEQAVLKRMAAENRDPFVVKLWWSFHDKDNLFLVMDFHPGGDLATQLARWGRLGRDRARFYAAEIVEGVEGLHAAGVIYRDLKPENILIGGDGHIVLTDFGLSKEFPRKKNSSANGFYSSVPGTPQPTIPPWMKPDRNGNLALGWPGQPIGHTDETATFCGTAEYLAPEVIQGLSYSYEVDWWSFGTMLYEMLTGITPFWADNHSDMYVRVLQDELHFPDDRAIDHDTKSLVRGLLQRVPSLRICEPRIKKHPYFSMIDWSHVYYKRYIPPYIPPIDPSNASDTQNFDDTFLDMEPVLDEYNDESIDTDQEPQTDIERTDGEDSNTTPSQSRSSSIRPVQPQPEEDDVDLFDGYSFKGRHSVLLDDEEEEGEEGSEEGSEEVSGGEGDDNLSILGVFEQPQDQDGFQGEEEEGLEPKTPEARPAALPPVVEIASPEPFRPSEEVIETLAEEVKEEPTVIQRKSKELSGAVPEVPPPVPPKPLRQQISTKTARPRKERSGVPALDRYLSDTIDEDAEATEAEREDDDWDFIEAGDGEDRNGAKGKSLFARGVVDKYKLKVFGKNSTPTSRAGQRVASGMSTASQSTTADSPSPSQRRGRTPLTFRKHPRQFLRAKSPPSFTNKSATPSRTPSASNGNSIAGFFTSSPSMSTNTFTNPPSLKSKESTTSVGGQSQSSDQSNGRSTVFVEAADAIQVSPQGNKHRGKLKLRKYKNNAEKVLSLFSSPRQSQF